MNKNGLRVAVSTGTERQVAPYLPANYSVVVETEDRVVIAGHDNAGWTLDDYVIPRLASGLYFAEEVELVPDWVVALIAGAVTA